MQYLAAPDVHLDSIAATLITEHTSNRTESEVTILKYAYVTDRRQMFILKKRINMPSVLMRNAEIIFPCMLGPQRMNARHTNCTRAQFH